ncbi:MAG TPA: hypothetical protein VHD63_13855 [Ktedonobacteraceae bacterium]|nr:hypothetical protein [Ktedonobacteraceae bacterium]
MSIIPPPDPETTHIVETALPGQSICYTPMLGDGPSQSTIATGIYCSYGCNAPVVTKAF